MKCSAYAECEVSFGYETHCVCEVHFRHDMRNDSLRFVRSTILHSGTAVSLAAERKTWQNRQRLFYILRQNVTQKLTVGTNPSIKNANPSFSYPLARKKHLRKQVLFSTKSTLSGGWNTASRCDIRLRCVKSLRRWVDFISLSAKQKISQTRERFFHILRQQKNITKTL